MVRVWVATTAMTALLGAAVAWAYEQRAAALREDEARAKDAAIVVVDIGSSSVRASAYVCVRGAWIAVDGSLCQEARAAIAADGTADMGSIQAAVERVLDGTIGWLTKQRAYAVKAVGFSAFGMSLVGVDAAGAPVTPVYTYAGQCADEATELRDALAKAGLQAEVYNHTGAPMHPAYAAPTLLRHNRHHRATSPVYAWQSMVGVLLRAWTTASHAIPMSYSEASWTGLLDFRSATWHEKLVAMTHTPASSMPPTQDPSIPVDAHLNLTYARRWPLLRDATFYLAFGDGAVANVGAKCTDPSRICLTIGTSAAMRVLVPLASLGKVPRGLWCYRVNATHVLLGGALTDGGSLYAWAKKTLALPSNAAAALEAMAPGAHGLTLLPFLHGERAPGWHAKAACTISGITAATTAIDILRASLESVALRLAAIYALLAPQATSDAVIVASGTALTSSRLWRQMIADAIGRKVVLETDAVETTSRGVAMAVGCYMGLSSSLDELQPLSSTLLSADPSRHAHAAYLGAREKQEALYHTLYA
ncbi:hypothetical protein SPRG_04150 [Saprolegnia parasitica CBS 223.65]|uniref:Carbohydrate kinase FGGY C-terminal domain-containing protein n=1 Tax=Saprolegnia parasitica (strain CBS 223.65) TaxID=695850 RepID=A0A067CVY1_SAPPC|nr:hypothetical protein SPRG_04150 [Saprolegnia parasitica CBS 223.65]KDO30962.1 hypothetical protein SPRG_04150 [Saprolegnia parasitica CBS 223.65]|eukprot:XP_012198146.1 hypothetical protein SPRG_04150 [Saprolegnia parasitica CBS 223.65]